MAATVNDVIGEISERVGDPTLTRITKEQVIELINAAARDLRGIGIVIYLQDDESLYIATATYEYAVPASFAYIYDIFEEGTPTDVGSNLNEELDTTETGVDVVDGTLYTTGDRIRIDSEWMQVTNVAANTLTVTRAVLGTTAATHTTGTAIFRGPGTYFNWVPWGRWRLKMGGVNAPTLWLDDELFTINIGRRVRLLGYQRPTDTYTIGAGNIDEGLEAFIRERATSMAARQLSEHTSEGPSQSALENIATQTWAHSDRLLQALMVHENYRPGRYARAVPLR